MSGETELAQTSLHEVTFTLHFGHGFGDGKPDLDVDTFKADGTLQAQLVQSVAACLSVPSPDVSFNNLRAGSVILDVCINNLGPEAASSAAHKMSTSATEADTSPLLDM